MRYYSVYMMSCWLEMNISRLPIDLNFSIRLTMFAWLSYSFVFAKIWSISGEVILHFVLSKMMFLECSKFGTNMYMLELCHVIKFKINCVSAQTCTYVSIMSCCKFWICWMAATRTVNFKFTKLQLQYTFSYYWHF